MKNKEIPFVFKNNRGKQLVGILHLPKTQEPPLVIICHGFQGTKTKRMFVKLARTLQENGLAVFRFDFEGCGDSEGKPTEITIEREVSDLSSALKAVLKGGNFDSKRIALVGYSLGSVVASLFKVREKFSVKTMVFWSQAFSQKELFKIWYKKEDLKDFKKKGVLIKGEKEIGKEYYLENSDRDYSDVLSKINMPILIIHGGNDKDVPLKFSKELVKKYKNISLEVLPIATHKFDDFCCQEELIVMTLEWLKKYL